MKTYLKLILLTTLLYGCAALGTKTLYKSSEKVSIKNFGYTELNIDSVHGVIPKKYSNTKTTFNATVQTTFKELGFDSVVFINHFFDFNKPDTVAIKEFCTNKNIEGIIISQLRFGVYQQGLGAVNYAATALMPFDTEVIMKLFDRNGRLIISTSHDTHTGNSYFGLPSQDTMVKDGTTGAVKQLGTELKTLSN